MKWLVTIVVLTLLPIHGAQASNQELLGTIPSVVDGKTKFASFELSLPSSLVLKSDTVVDWRLDWSFTNEQGDEFISRNGIYSHISPASGRVIPSGRKASFNLGFDLAVKVSFIFTAQVNEQLYSLSRDIQFLPGNQPDFTRLDLPKLLKDFNIEIDNLNPGLDEQIVVRARATWDEEDYRPDIKFQWLTFNGSLIENFANLPASRGEWRQVQITAEQYARTGFVLGASWTLSESPGSSLVFLRKIPIEIAFKAKSQNIKEFSWAFTDGKQGQVSRYDFPERGNKAGNIEMEATVDWGAIDRNVDCVEARWTLQYQVGNKWIIDGDDPEYSEVNYGVCRRKEATELDGRFIVSSRNEQGKWLSGSRNYRIWNHFQEKSVAKFKVFYSPDDYASTIKVSFPNIVQYGKTYTVTATVTPKFNGTCTFFRYYFGDVPIGKSKLVNGKASLTFKVLWPRSTIIGDQTQSMIAACSGGKYSSRGGTIFLGTGD